MTATQTAVPTPADDTDPAPSRRPLIGIGLALVAAITLRFLCFSPLWLDEAQTVAISHRSLSALFSALRVDGSPPLFYLLLHFWMLGFGTSTFAVRALAGVLSVACLPAAWLAARRIGLSRELALAATLLVATNPFAVYYATQARMYSLVLLLALLAIAAFERVCRSRSPWYVVAAALVTAALLLTHYWSLFFYAAGGLLALIAVMRGNRPARRVLAALVLAAVPFAAWAPTFVFQTMHTGAPWGTPPGIDTVLLLPLDWSGPGLTGKLLAAATYLLVLVALAGRARRGLVFRRPVRRLPLLLMAVAGSGIVIATIAGAALGSAYANRYSTAALAPTLLAMAIGIGVLPARRRAITIAVVSALGLVSAAGAPTDRRTQADEVVARLHPSPGDVVAFCPDQLGPAVHRLAPNAGRQVVYPTFASPAMVNWVDYKTRIENSHPAVFARRLLAMAGGHTIYLVYATDYKLYEDDCSEVATDLAATRGTPHRRLLEDTDLIEHDTLDVFRKH